MDQPWSAEWRKAIGEEDLLLLVIVKEFWRTVIYWPYGPGDYGYGHFSETPKIWMHGNRRYSPSSLGLVTVNVTAPWRVTVSLRSFFHYFPTMPVHFAPIQGQRPECRNTMRRGFYKGGKKPMIFLITACNWYHYIIFFSSLSLSTSLICWMCIISPDDRLDCDSRPV